MTRSHLAYPSRFSQADFEAIAESIPHVVWTANADGSTDYFNRLGTDYTGLSREERCGWEWLALVDRRDADRARLVWDHAIRTATPLELSCRIRRGDGAFRRHVVRALPWRGHNGETVKWIATANEIDDRTGVQDETNVVERQPAELGARFAAGRVGPRIELSLLGTFTVRIGGRGVAEVSLASQRVLAFLALHDRVVARVLVGGTLWPEVSDHKAGLSLRSALSRLDTATRDAVRVIPSGLRIDEAVAVDLRDSQALAQRLLHRGAAPPEADLSPHAVTALSRELLPDWYDDWVVEEAEDWRLLRVNALEALARLLTARGRLPEAAVASRAAIRVDPLRESAQASLIRVHLAEGNQSEALRVFNCYRTLLRRQLGLEPTPILAELVAAICQR